MTHPRADEVHRVFLHVGSPKTGTTFLQHVLWSQHDLAAEQGLLLPMQRFFDHYLASLDVRGLAEKPEHPDRAVGMWDRMVAQAESWPGTSLISHELFAGANAVQARRALATFSPETEVHVVLTVRDLMRQIPAEWQEHVKHRSTKRLAEFVEELVDDQSGTSWFWRVQDYADVLQRWGQGLPSSRLHVVTVPPRGADPSALWHRFCSLLGVDAASFDTASSRGNTSLGLEQVELLRRVNEELGDTLRIPGPYPRVVKEVFAQQLLAARTGTQLRLDQATTDFALARSRAIVDRLREMDVQVIGDLDELVVDPRGADGAAETSYAGPDDAALLRESIAAIAGLLRRLSNNPDEREYRRLTNQLRQRPVRFALAQAGRQNPTIGKAHRLYQRSVDLARRARAKARRRQ